MSHLEHRAPAPRPAPSGLAGNARHRFRLIVAGNARRFRLTLVAALLLGVLPLASSAGTQVRFTTSLGAFTIELEDERAPLTVANFLRYVRDGHYAGTIFHRVVPGFVIQGGGLTAQFAPKPVREPVVNESGNGLVNVRGSVGLARTGAPHSGDAQFFVNLADNTDLNPLPSRWGYAVFGRVVEGMGVVDRIGVLPTGPMGPLKSDVPQRQVLIEKAEVLGAAGATGGAGGAAGTVSPHDSAPDGAASGSAGAAAAGETSPGGSTPDGATSGGATGEVSGGGSTSGGAIAGSADGSAAAHGSAADRR